MLPSAFNEKETKFTWKDKNGVAHPHFVADTALAKRLSGLTQIMDDLKYGHELMAMVNDTANTDVAYSLWMSAIVTYGKCFATAKGRRIKIESNHVLKADSEALDFHQSILDMRNEYFAHAGINDYERASTVVILSPTEMGKSVVAVNHLKAQHTKPSQEFCVSFCHLCRKLYDVVESIGEEVHRKVLDEYRSMNIDTLYEKIET
ncbi:MAG: hypothetical protein JJT87_12530 [Halomonas sp.]|nr:hypothetical protein [Halomonas sp.]MCC5902736.1 hypothetical protein [Halomonas sp.]